MSKPDFKHGYGSTGGSSVSKKVTNPDGSYYMLNTWPDQPPKPQVTWPTIDDADISDGRICTCNEKRDMRTAGRNPNCPIHAEDVNRKVIVEIEAPASLPKHFFVKEGTRDQYSLEKLSTGCWRYTRERFDG